VDYDLVAFAVVPGAHRGLVDAFQVSGRWVTEGELGPLRMGGSYFLPFRRRDDPGSTDVRLRITCTSGEDRWTVPAEVYLLPH
jgi:hypothetical protein